jgi:ferredoxin-NADP reductase
MHDEAANIKTFCFTPERAVQYTPGQYAEWTLKHPRPDNRGVKRWFTLSSSPTEDHISITTKFNDKKSSSFKKALFGLKPGDEILVSDPMGDFVLPKLIQTPLIFVAGGIGITPFRSMLTWLSATGETRPIKLLYAVRGEDEIIFQETFDKANIHATIVVSDPSPAWGGERGRLSAELILGLGQPPEDGLVYVSGPEPMVEILEKDLKRAGLAKHQFVGDFFPNYTSV